MAKQPGEAKPNPGVQRIEQPQVEQEVDFRALLDGSLDVVCLLKVSRGSQSCLYATPSTLEVLGWTPEEFMEIAPAAFLTAESQGLVAADIGEIIDGQPSSMLELEAIHKDGHHIWLECMVRALGSKHGEIYVAVCMRDVTRRKLLEEQLVSLAMRDGLTGIANRRAFDETLGREWRRAMREGALLSLVLIDVDRFKLFNDNYGHQAGDDALRAIAGAVSGEVKRPGDMVARYGGEEIAVLLPATNLAGAEVVANGIREAAARLRIPHVGNPDLGGVITVSCGVATAEATRRGTIRMPEGLVQAADLALYKAKSAGRNRVAAALPLHVARDEESPAAATAGGGSGE